MSLRLFGKQLMSRHMNRCLNSNNKTNRLLHSSVCANSSFATGGGGSYEGDGKTTVSIMNKSNTGYLMVDTYSAQGFRLSNGQFAFGPIALFPSVVLQWDVSCAETIDEKSLSLFTLVEPRIEVLVIGVGDDTDENRKSNDLNQKLRSILSQMKINCEILPTKHAISTYNYMCVDHRVCAGAFLPPFIPDIDKDEDPWLTFSSKRFISSDGNIFF